MDVFFSKFFGHALEFDFRFFGSSRQKNPVYGISRVESLRASRIGTDCIGFDRRLGRLYSLTIAFSAHPTIRKLIQIAPGPPRGAVSFRFRSPESSKAKLGFRSDAVHTGVRDH